MNPCGSMLAKHVSAFFEYRLIDHLKFEEEPPFPAFRAVLHGSIADRPAAERPSRASGESRGDQGRRARLCELFTRTSPELGADGALEIRTRGVTRNSSVPKEMLVAGTHAAYVRGGA